MISQQLPPFLLADWLSSAGPSLLLVLLTITCGWLALRIGERWLARAMGRARVDLDTQVLVRRTVSVAIVALMALMILGILGASGGTLIALTGAIGLALSLAVQDILKNFFSGIYLLLERPFRLGDVISVKEQTGRVVNVGVRTTIILTDDGVQVLVPNALVFAEVVRNQTNARPTRPEPTPPATKSRRSARVFRRRAPPRQ